MSGGLTAVLAVPTLSLLLVLNQLTPFWNALCVEPLFRPVLRLLPQVVRAYHGVNIQFMV